MSRAVFARETLVDVAARHAAESCGRSAFRYIDGAGREAASITFGELDARARSIGGWLQDRIAPSDRVLLLFPSGIDFISAFLGCLYAGAIAVPATPPRLRGRGADRLANIVRDAEPSLALVASGTPEQFGVRTEAISGIGSQWAEAWRRPSLSSDDIAFLQYTSGSTTTPRGVMITHRNLMANEDAIQRAFGVRTDSIICGWLPLHHDMGLIGCILQPVYSAAACILMSPESFVQRPARWLKCISQYRAHISGAPDTAYGLCADKIAPREIDEMDLSAWRVAFNGAEPVRAATMQRFNERFARAGFQPSAWRPCYGLAESTLLVTVTSQSSGPARIEIGRPEGGDVLTRVSCGAPPEVDSSDLSSEVLIVDPAERQRKTGEEIGEIWLRGPSVAAGYWRRDAETAETFRATLVGGEDHYLRTGDLGLFRSGELFLVGRQKDLIILNGRNLYPQDIESTVEQCHRAIRTGAVAAVGVEANGREELAIVCELDGRLATDRKAILSAIRSSVAREHEATPCSITFVDRGRLPRTTSGKIRRYACRELALDAMRQSRDGLQDSDLIGEVARVLGVPAADVSLDRPLTELGLDSIRAIEVAHWMERFAGMRISPASLLEGAPVGLLISSGLPASAPASRAESVRYPLSVNQEALYRAEQTSPGDSGHQLVAAAMVHGKVDERAIRDALATLASRYDALRIRIVMEGQTPLQEAVNAIAIPLQEVDASELSPEGLAELMRRRILEPIGLDSAPLWRVDLYRISANAAALLLRIHHIVADHWSVSRWFDDFVRLLGGGELERGAPVQGYEAFVRWQHDWFSTDESRQAEEYWSRKLEAEVPPVRFASRESSTVHSTVRRLLAARLTDRVHELCRQCEITPFAIYSAIYSILLSRHASQAKIRFGTPAAVRSAAFAESVFGYLVNPIPIEADTGPDRSFRDFAVALHHEVADGIRHANHPMLRMKSAGAEPVFNTVLTMQPSRGPHGSDFNHFVLGFNGAAIESGQLRLESMAIDPGPPEYDAILMLAECERGLLARLQLKAGAGSGELAERLLSDFERLLEQAVGHPNVCIHSVSLVTAGELLELQTLRESEPPRPKRDCLHRWFEEEVRLFPDRAAVSADDETLTYKDLNRRANQLARYLRERGLGAECLIALYLGRTPATVSAILGVLKSGAAYVPLDPAYPAERVRYILKDSGCKLVITESGPQETLSADAGTDAVCLNSIRQECNHYPDDNPDWEVVSGNAAYVIYTSGSTGTPKGCVVTHANVTRLFAASESLFHFSESDVWSVFHSFAFDFSVWELWGALLYGGRAVIVPYWVSRSPDEFLRLLRDERVTMASQTPSAFRELAKLSSTALSVCAVVFGGEELPFSILRPWMCGAQPQFINMYGITETTVHVTYRPVEAAEAVALHTASMIGRALPDMELYVLDSHMQAVPQV
jgi:amino acid adenylation domain-containing protein